MLKKLIIYMLFCSLTLFIFVVYFVKAQLPVYYNDYINLYAKQYNLDKSLVYSVIKVESNFNNYALSLAGAKGLMQIMDLTAVMIADDLQIDYYDIYDAKTNINFGCYYLNYLFNKYKNLDVVLYCYNAGEGNYNNLFVDKNIIFNVNDLPKNQTYYYIKKVNKYLKIYNKFV